MTRTPKRPRDPSQLAKFIVDAVTGDLPASIQDAGNRGSQGGKRRAEILPRSRKVEIAKKGAATRWSKGKVANETTE